jgi:hypothetical protein
MAEPGPYRDVYLDAVTDFPEKLPAGVERSTSYYAHEVVTEDGVRVTTWFKRGDPSKNIPEQQVAVERDVIPKLKEAWDAKVAKETPSASSQQTARRDTETIDGRVKQFNPETGRFDIDLGSASDPAVAERQRAAEARQQANDERANAREDRIAATASQNAEIAQSREARADRTEDRQTDIAARQAETAEQTNQRGWAELALRAQSEQRLSDAQTAELRNGKVIQTPDGRTIQIRNGPDGTASVEDVTPPSKPGSVGTLPENTHLGTIYSSIQAAAQKISEDTSLTPEQKNKKFDQIQAAATLLAQNSNAILTAQQNSLTNRTSQRNVDVQDAASRRTFAAGQMSDAFSDVSKLKTPAGSGLAGPAFLGRLMLGLQVAEKVGGLKTFPREQGGQAIQQADTLGLPGMPSGAQQPQGPVQQPAAAGAGGSSPTINIINGVPQANAAPQSVQSALPQMPGGGFMPPGSGMSFDGGQLRAPGYSEDQERPAWMDQLGY